MCGLRNLVLVNLLHGKYKFMGEEVLLHRGPPLEKEKHLLPSQSAVFLCFVLCWGLLLFLTILVQEGIISMYSIFDFSM